MKKVYKFLSLVLLLLSASGVDARNIYVAKNGNDSNSGTLTQPYLTVTKAANVAVAGDHVYIREGSYEEVLRPANSGTNGNPITFQGYQNEKAIITAMQALSGFSQDQGSIYKKTITWDMGQQNFVMHEQMALDLARWPNNTDGDSYTMDAKRNDGGSGQNDINAHLIDNSGLGTDLNGNPIDWSQGGSIHFYGDRPGSGWICWRAFITSSTATRVDFQLDKNPSWIRTFHEPAGTGEYFLQGAKQALDYQNEWYFDGTTKTLYLQIPSGGKPADGAVQMRRRELTVNLENRNDIVIKDLAVFGGEIIINGNRNKLEGVTSLYGNHTLGVVNNSFSSGNQSVDIRGNDNVIEKCNIGHGAGSGIADRAKNTIIRNSYIHEFNTLGSYDAILNTRGGDGGTYINNIITRGGRDAIQGSSTNSEYAYNDVSYSNLIADDCALFYVVGGPKNSEIHHNWFHDAYSHGSKRKAAGVYLDNDAHSFSVHHNVIWNTEWTAFQINWDGTNLDIFNNTVFNNQSPMGAWHKAGTQFYDVRVWNNLADKDGSNAGGQESESTWEPQADKQNNLVDSNGFNDPTNFDFTLKAGAQAIDFGRLISEPKFGIGAPFNYTEGFVGATPDAGAYEYGKPEWTAGIDWNIEEGPIGLCYGLPGEECTGDVTPTEVISFVNQPINVTSETSYDISFEYTTTEARDVVANISAPNGDYISETRITVQEGTGSQTLTVNVNPALPIADGYRFRVIIRSVGGNWTDNVVLEEKLVNVKEPFVCPNTDTYNECFESGVYTWGGWGAATKEVQSVVTNNGSFALKVAGLGASNFTVTGLTPNTTYEFSGFVKIDGTQGVNFGVKEYDVTGDQAVFSTNTSFEKKTISFTTGPTNTSAQIYLYSPNANGIGYLDYVAIINQTVTALMYTESSILNIFPNPTSGIINFQTDVSWKLHNVQGKLLKKGKGRTADISELDQGTYLIYANGKVVKVLKQ